MEGQAPRPKRSRKEEYRAKVRLERTLLPFELYDVVVRGVPALLIFGGAGVLLVRKGHHVGGVLVCIAGALALAYVGWTYIKEAKRLSDASVRRRERRASRRDARTRP